MSNHGHHHRSHRRRSSLLGRFIDRLTGRGMQHSSRRSEFPGISLPKDHDEAKWKHRVEQAPLPGKITPDADQPMENDGTVDNQPVSRPVAEDRDRISSSGKRGFLYKSLELYFRKREIRKEERFKEKMRKQNRRRSEEEYRKLNQGPSMGQRLLDISRAEEEAARHTPLFSNRSMFFRNLTLVVNSFMVYVITYILVYLFYWLTCMLVASWYGIDSTLYFYDLKFNDHSRLWSRFNILLITGIPPFISLFLGIYLFQIIFKIKRFVGLQKLFILWMALHLFNHFFGAFPSGIVTDEGFGYVAAWLYMNTAIKFLFALLSLFALGIIGYYSAKHILETSDSLGRIKRERRTSFMFYQVGLPWLIGTIVLLLVRSPHNFDFPYETLMLFSMAFIVIPPFFNEKAKPELNLLKVKKKRQVNLGYLAMMLVMLAFLRIMLGIGLHFLIEINISISPAVT